MYSIVDRMREYGVMHDEFAFAAEQLHKVAMAEDIRRNAARGELKDEIHAQLRNPQQDRSRARLLGRVLEPAFDAKMQIADAELQRRLTSYLTQKYGLAKGPCQNALAEFSTMVVEVRDCGYNLADFTVQQRFFQFLLAYVTSGFKEKDTNGTQMGQYRGDWRGGGFAKS
ncbi:hypothetical protein SAMN05421538_1073 [Paracoccus isoporae]|uniref:Uncharacterized protein n=1 Tax=Paracoccus isoporae TaxID=591205 RepID=A0A1G7D5X9_9RHOB|nr:hypothetical protein [Paracoccus isoporae]SDE47028.1 hypothetical protein SAMN05421538_1073 [Paracoccus isoporae]